MPSWLLATVLCAGCGGPWRDGYFKKGINHLSQDNVIEKMGPPHTAKTPALGGDTIWTYRVPLTEKELSAFHISGLADATKQAASLLGKPGEGPKERLYCYRYTLTFNEEKILKQWKREECVPGTRDQLNAE
ncbi:conserved exported protein of unknown function [Nitrospira sp. KM1]|uniref:hypothetical protein n=1 Tax=Nitrospira sp. KM1 TaxID=1936990 RepID=UPI0013A797FA|nr:hypothetical protein [Nitrospira sp. KM1]BCA55188.1 conserved exported protein of unknown function [Nitrospira sp. KM1]